MPTLTKKLKVGDSMRSIVFDDEEPWPLQGEVGTVKDQRCRNALNSETRCWRKWSSTVDDQPKVPPWQHQVWNTWRIDGGIVTISIFGSTSIPFPLYFAIHFPILFKSSFTISITKLFYFQTFYYSAFYYSAFHYSSHLFSAPLLSNISTSINTLDFHL